MKTQTPFKPLLLLVLLVAAGGLGHPAMAQVLPFPTQNASWSVYSFSNYQSDTLEYYLDGDTLLYDGNWSKLFRRNLQGEANYCGAIKDSDGIVEIKLPEEEKRLLYDFTLEVGDTFPYSPFFYGYDDYGEETYSMMVVERVDTVQLLNGESRREIVSNMVTSGIYEEVQERWIEGLGSIHGPLFPLNPKLLAVEVHEEFTLVCFSENDELLYHNPLFTSCFLGVNIEKNEVADQYVQIYPNPTGGTLTVESASPIREITVYDLSGRVVVEAQNITVVEAQNFSPQQYPLNVSSLQNGLYLLKAVTDSGVQTARFVKN